jgi:Icc-related predicted phosphoesterase
MTGNSQTQAGRARRLLVLGDVHHHRERLERALDLVADDRFDVALLTGDVAIDPPWTEPERTEHRETHDASLRWVLERVRSTVDGPVVFVPGNHDMPVPPGEIVGVNADRQLVQADGLRVAGFGGAGPGRFGFAYEWSERQAARVLEAAFGPNPDPVDLFLCHTPPADTTLDRTAKGRHVGSRTVRRWIGRLRPGLFVCGHIHEAWGIERVDGHTCLNAGALGEPFGRLILWIVEWDDGPTRIDCLRQEEGADVVRERVL